MYFYSVCLLKLAPRSLALLLAFGVVSSGPAYATEPLNSDAYQQPTPVSTDWEFRVTPYAWAPSVNGDVTVRGHTADIDMSFWDLLTPVVPART